MDRIISLLAALVGLIALGGAILVHVNGDVQRQELAAQIAELKTAISMAPPAIALTAASANEAVPAAESAPSAASIPSALSSQVALDPAAVEIRQLQDQIAELKQQNRDQASQLAEAQVKLAAGSLAPNTATVEDIASSSSAASTEPISAVIAPSEAPPSSSASLAPVAVDGPTADCIPAGTRFVGKPGESFAICKTKVVVKIAAISDGIATIEGAGPIAAGSFGDLAGKGCSVMVFSADATGFADLRVTCQ